MIDRMALLFNLRQEIALKRRSVRSQVSLLDTLFVASYIRFALFYTEVSSDGPLGPVTSLIP